MRIQHSLFVVIGWVAAAGFILSVPTATAQDADLILEGTVWTGNPDQPRAEAVAIRGNRILAVGSAEAVAAHRAEHTTTLAPDGGFITPGFIDNHTHFNRAGELLLGINLLDVASADQLRERVRAARDRLPEGAWIVGGDWGAYEAEQQGTRGRAGDTTTVEPFRPHRNLIDPITPNTPVVLSKWDGSMYLANAVALERAGADCNWDGVECVESAMTGRLTESAAERILDEQSPKAMAQRLAEARVAMERLRSQGVTTIHDITGPEQFAVFQALKQQGELTVRIYARPTLDKWRDFADVGIEHGFGSDWIRTGGLKGFVDGIMGNSSARFYEPYLTTGERGRWRDMMYPPGNMQTLITEADAAGLWPQVHAIGDHAIDTLLTMFERAIATNGPKERRFRVIHTQVLRGPEVAARMARNDIIAEVQPYHAIDDMRWMEKRIGDRARWAYAFKTLQDAGVLLSFGSDWPGTNAAWYPADPVLGIYAAVTRQTLDGVPEGGWFPQERVDVETALRAFTVNNAYAEGAEEQKGMLKPGLLADVTVLSNDLTAIPGAQIKDVDVLVTIVDGEIVYHRDAE